MKDKKTRNDLILIGVIVAVLLLVGGALLLFGKQGDVVVVTVDGELYATYPLDQDIEVDIVTGTDGQQSNHLVIKDGKAYISDANCPGGKGNRCTRHAPISRDFESIICSPHKVIVSVESGK